MDFVKKNIGLLLFLLLCLGGIVYLMISIIGANKLKAEQIEVEKGHVDFFERIKKENLRLNEENVNKAKGKLAQAEQKYVEFRDMLAERRLVKDDDEEFKEFISLAPALAQSRMMVMIEKVITDNFDELSFNKNRGMGGMDGGMDPMMMQDPGMMGPPAGMMQPGMGMGNNMMMKGINAKNAKKTDEELAAEEKKQRHLLKAGTGVTPYLCFDRYAAMKAGLNKDDMVRIYKQLKVVELVIGIIRESEVTTLSDFNLLKSIEKLEEGDYEWTPISITVVGKQDKVQSLLNKLSTNPKFFFFIRQLEMTSPDILLDQIVEMKEALNKEMSKMMTKTVQGGMGMAGGPMDTMGGMGNPMEPEMGGMMDEGTRRGRRGRRARRSNKNTANGMGDVGGAAGMMQANGGMMGMNGMQQGMMGEGMTGEGMMGGGALDPYAMIPLTRKDLRVFDADKDVTMTIRFDLIEFKSMAENN